jgi:hypothetical protein
VKGSKEPGNSAMRFVIVFTWAKGREKVINTQQIIQ